MYTHVSPMLQIFPVCYISLVTLVAPLISPMQYNTTCIARSITRITSSVVKSLTLVPGILMSTNFIANTYMYIIDMHNNQIRICLPFSCQQLIKYGLVDKGLLKIVGTWIG